MRRTRSTRTLVELIDEPKRYVCARNLLIQIKRAMAKDENCRPLKEFGVPSNDDPHSSIVNSVIHAYNFELKPSLLQIVQQNQFLGKPTEVSNLHLSAFVQFADTL